MKHFYLVILLFVCSLGFSQENAKSTSDIDGFKLYPNPVTQGKVYIETTLNSPKKILVFDVLGTKVLETTILGQNKVATRKLIVK